MRRVVVVFFSDSHAGHKLGLLNPNLILEMENETGDLVPWKPEPTAVQGYLWRLYGWAIGEVRALAGDDEVVLVHVGDPTQGHAHMDQLVSTRLADQVLIAESNFEPWLDLPNVQRIRLAYSTASHVFGEGSADVLLVKLLKNKRPDLDVRALYHGNACVDGARIDFSHHGPGPGIRVWTHGNVARHYLRSLMLKCLLNDEPPPDLVVRGHFHDWVNEVVCLPAGNLEWMTRLIVLPAMSMIGDYGRKATKSEFIIRNGMAAAEIVDGQIVQVHKLIKQLDIRTEEQW